MGFDQFLERIPKLETKEVLISWDNYENYKEISECAEELAYFRKFYDLNKVITEATGFNANGYDEHIAVIVNKDVLQKCIDFLNEDIKERDDDGNCWYDEEEREMYVKALIDITTIIKETNFETHTIFYHAS